MSCHGLVEFLGEVASFGAVVVLVGIPKASTRARFPLRRFGDGESPCNATRPGATALTRALCMLILLLMATAAAYGASIAFRYFRQIGV